LSFNPRENLQFVPDNDARNVSTRSHPWIAAGMSLIPISLYVTMSNLRVVEWSQTQKNIALTQKTRPEMHREVRAITNFSQEMSLKASRGKTW
jgi:hypothetical protein